MKFFDLVHILYPGSWHYILTKYYLFCLNFLMIFLLGKEFLLDFFSFEYFKDVALSFSHIHYFFVSLHIFF